MVFQGNPYVSLEAFVLGAFDRALSEPLSEGLKVKFDPLLQLGISNALTREKARLGRRTGEFIPRANVLTDVATENPVPDS